MVDPDARPLSPISELTTPASFRTISLPHFESPDYTSERERSPAGSLHSHASVDTVGPSTGRSSTSEAASTSVGQTQSISLPSPYIVPEHQAEFPSQSFSTVRGGLPTPPQRDTSMDVALDLDVSSLPDNDEARKRYIAMMFPRAMDEPHDAKTTTNAIANGGRGSGIAGIGAGSGRLSRPHSIRSRPVSLYGSAPVPTSPEPGDIVSLV